MGRRGSAVAVALAAALALAGCGREDDDPRPLASGTTSTPPASATPSDEGPAAAYAAWLDALSRRDAAGACAHHAPDFTIALRQQAILEDRAELGDPCTGFVALLWEDPDRQLGPESVETTHLTGEKATLAVTFPGVDETVDLVFHRAEWRIQQTAERSRDAVDDPAGPEAGPYRWIDHWCDLDPSMSRAEIVALMGRPSGEYSVADGGEPQLWWAKDQFDFRVYLDVDGSVLELVGDYDALSDEDRDLLPCPELRS